MVMMLERLKELVEPPKRPLGCSNESNWALLHDIVGFKFPEEFLAYARCFGTGEFNSAGYGLLVGNPLDPKFPKWILAQSEIMRTRGDGPELRSTRFFPELDGVMPFASDWSGDLAFFTPCGNVVAGFADPAFLINYECRFEEFLVKMFSARLEPEWFPNRELKKGLPSFKATRWL